MNALLNKSETGGRILESLLIYGKMIESTGLNIIKVGRNVIKIRYRPIDLPSMYAPEKCGGKPQFFTLEKLREIRKRCTNHSLYIYFRGKLDFYKDFSMYYIFVDNDDGTKRLRSIQERQYHREDHSYWTTTYGLPFTEERIHSMLYDALNMAFEYRDDEKNFEKLITAIKMKTVEEV